ncbi:DAK2 domain-containing protein [Enterocloster lavalensis]|uniref:DAK2 domain-containing protein n=4 Tax=Enterocloster lavalensis TaxID=460384 RepID=UPI002A828CC5|nr:DAK2 domain-containing protein [Enterocloster lavalensis]
MMDAQGLAGAMGAVAGKIEENKEYLTRLDQLNGDGDLGISMSEGFKAVDMLLEISEEKDLGKLLMKAGNAFNEAAPSSLGTILSFGLTGMAKALKGTREAGGEQIAAALKAGVDKIMEKAGSKPGERTILDSLCPAVEAYAAALGTGACPLEAATKAAATGAEATKQMKPVHGRAAYYGEKCLGNPDGGAVVGQLIFEALSGYETAHK